MLENMVKKFRMENKMSQYELAEKAQVARVYITLLEAGKRSNPSKEVMEKISHALGKTVQEVFFPNELDLCIEEDA